MKLKKNIDINHFQTLNSTTMKREQGRATNQVGRKGGRAGRQTAQVLDSSVKPKNLC